MKLYKLGLFLCVALFLFSCEKETEGLSRSTYYVAFDIKGDNPAIVQVGAKYTDEGVIATEQGKDVTSTISTKSNVDYTAMGMYKVEYTATNIDGLKSKAIRDVIVCNPSVTTNLAGKYAGQAGTERLNTSSGAVVSYPGYHATITYLAPGFFSVNDFFAGYYAERVYPEDGYSVVGMSGHFALNEDNTITLIDSYVAGWRNSLDKLENAKYDPETGEVSWDAYWNGTYKFHVILKK